MNNRQEIRSSTLESLFDIRRGIDSFETTWFEAEKLFHVETNKSMTRTRLESIKLSGFNHVVTTGTKQEGQILVVLKDELAK